MTDIRPEIGALGAGRTKMGQNEHRMTLDRLTVHSHFGAEKWHLPLYSFSQETQDRLKMALPLSSPLAETPPPNCNQNQERIPAGVAIHFLVRRAIRYDEQHTWMKMRNRAAMRSTSRQQFSA